MSKSLVLIADDDVAIRTVLEKKLQRSGFTTRSTGNGQELFSCCLIYHILCLLTGYSSNPVI